MKRILVAYVDPLSFQAIEQCFQPEYLIDAVADRKSCLELFNKRRYEFLFIDVELLCSGSLSSNGRTNYKELLQPFWRVFPNIRIVIMSSQEKIRDAVMAVKAGAGDYITYPINRDELKHITENIYESTLKQEELGYLRDRFWAIDSLEIVNTKSPRMKKVFEKIRLVAPTKMTVLLTGETGTGKGVLARLIHRHSNRAESQFISVHCGAIPDTLIESELFGHEKGAFTGADRRKLGKFEIAQKGTIFLDEIGTITPSAQVKLLQVLQEKTFQRVGGETDIEADARIIAATNEDLKQMSLQGRFRKDLFYRLSVFPIDIPPLRERLEDIPYLADVFLKRLNKLYSKEIYDVDQRVLSAFENYEWPGNIRELENLMERAYILESSPVLTAESFPIELFVSDIKAPGSSSSDSFPTLSQVRAQAIEAIEKNYLNNLLSFYKGHIQKSATAAGISSRQLHKLMSRYGIKKEGFKNQAVISESQVPVSKK